MTKLEQAARQALGALEVATTPLAKDRQEVLRAITTLREALEQAAPKAAPGVGSSGFDYQTAADFLSGKTVSDEAVRKFVAASRWAHDERAALSATLLAMHGVLASREAEIALLKKALMEAEAAPQQEAQNATVAAFEAVRKKLCTLPRYSFALDDDGLVRRAPDRTGNWIEFDEAHTLFDPVSVDAAIAAQGGK